MYPILITIALGVTLTRFIPFILLKDKKIPKKYENILDAIPYATVSLLVVYAFKDLNSSTLLASLVASSICIILYLWKRNTILSILLSTIVYMFVIQTM